MDILFNDFRHALRTLYRRPGFVAAVALTLAIAIGANTLVFSLIDSIYLKALPYPNASALIELNNSYAKSGPANAGVSIPDYLDRRAGVTALADSALYTGTNPGLSSGGAPERLRGLMATPSLFSTLGVAPQLGRTFGDDEALPNRDKVVVIANALWRNRFNSDPGIVGRDIRLDGQSYRVVGVMPEAFMFPNRETQIYLPFAFSEEQKDDRERGHEYSNVVARLAPGASIAQVKLQSDAIIQRNAERIGALGAEGAGFRDFIAASGFTVTAQPLRELLAGGSFDVLLLLQGAVLLVLLIACANIANLLMTRFSSRQKEFSVRVALGAGRMRIARQLILEAMILALIGGAAGLAIALAGGRLVDASGLLPDWVMVTPNLRLVGICLLFSLLASLIFGMIPILSVMGMKARQVMSDAGRLGSGGRKSNRARAVLAVVQLALAVTLLAGSALLLRSFSNVLNEDPGFDSKNLLTAAVALPSSKFADGPAQVRAVAQILQDVRNLPGVESATISDENPFSSREQGASYRIAGRPDNGASLHGHTLNVDADYFKTMEIPVLRGRTFTRADWDATAQVAIIDQAFEKKNFPDGDALNHQLNMGSPTEPVLYDIVGVVANVRTQDMARNSGEETFYRNFARRPSNTILLTLRTSTAPQALIEPLRSSIRSVDPDLVAFDIKTMDQRINLSMTGRRVPMQLLIGFASIALLLAGIGVYGVLAFGVAQRTSELGVRMAIGATALHIGQLVLKDGARLIAFGLAAGSVGAILLGFLIRSQLFGVGSIDPPSLLLVLALLAATGFVACWLPARRAARTTPMEALRDE
ncbi:MAG TPA: ABC transporter permease [Dokdonella sp.]|uniref:ABC transporter permease n=1 Tax=Dokdonella sp. TaxID=2291710 RepID=UPI002D7E158F|nr:ABC transporter permease [Dokdonella sp.]HET9033602.1 ABC transporter permease [Dokdonella sp.]